MWINPKHVVYLLIYICTGSANSLLVKRSQILGSDGAYHYAYEPVTVTLSITLFKLFVTTMYVFVFQSPNQSIKQSFDQIISKIRVARLFIIPAGLYFIFDVLAFFNLQLVTPATFRLLINLKVLFSGILLDQLIGQRLSLRQWMALCVLLVACCVEQIDSFDPHTGFLAIISICFQAFCSSAAGVYFQYLLQPAKNEPATANESAQLGLWEKNLFMYSWTLLFNVFYLVAFSPKTLQEPMVALSKFDWNVLPIIVTSGVGGFCTSLILRDMSVIAKEYANFAEMCVVVVGSALWLGTPIHLTLIIAVLMVTGSLYLYNVTPHTTPVVVEKTISSPDHVKITPGLNHRKLSSTTTRPVGLSVSHPSVDSIMSGGEETDSEFAENAPLIGRSTENHV